MDGSKINSIYIYHGFPAELANIWLINKHLHSADLQIDPCLH